MQQSRLQLPFALGIRGLFTLHLWGTALGLSWALTESAVCGVCALRLAAPQRWLPRPQRDEAQSWPVSMEGHDRCGHCQDGVREDPGLSAAASAPAARAHESARGPRSPGPGAHA